MTDKELKDLVASLAVQNKETDRLITKLSEEMRKRDEEWRKRDAEEWRKRDEEWRKRDEEWRKRDEEARKKDEEAWRKRDEEVRKRDEEVRKRDEEARKRDEEARKKDEEEWRKRDEEARKRDEEARKKDEEARKRDEEEWRKNKEEIWKILRNTDKQLGTMSDHDGDHAEQYFQNIFNDKLEFGGMKYDKMFANFECSDKKKGLRTEFDIVLVNCKSVAIIEVKNSIRSEFVWKLVKDRLPVFRQFFPEYNDHKVYLGIAGFSFSKKVLEQAEKYGVGVIRQVGDSAEAMTGKLKAY